MNGIKSNKGASLPLVLALIAVMMLVAIAVIAIVSQDMTAISRMNVSEQALHIAEAGYNQYLWLLNDDSMFYRDGENPELGFIIQERYGDDEHEEWDGLTKTYQPVKYYNNGEEVGSFQIRIIPPTVNNPVVGGESAGWSKDSTVKRAVFVEIHKRQFTNYVLFDSAEGDSEEIRTGSHMKGPYFTNGDLVAQRNAVFHDTVGYAGRNLGSQATYLLPQQPVQMERLQKPSSNDELIQWADPEAGGMTYTGRTSILLNGTKLKVLTSDGTLLTDVSHPPNGVIHVTGDLFISGVLDGRLTIIAGGNIYVCAKDPTDQTIGSSQARYDDAHDYGGITYANRNIPHLDNGKSTLNMSDDMLGLVTDKDIIIHTIASTWPAPSTSLSNLNIVTVQKDIDIQAALYCNTVKVYEVDWNSMNFFDFILALLTNSNPIIHYFSEGFSLDQIHYLGSRTVGENTSPGTYYEWEFDFLWWHETIVIDWAYSSENLFDYRMLYEAPPHFVQPANSGWEVKSWKEVQAAD